MSRRNWITHLMVVIILLRIQPAVAHMSLLYPMPRGGVLDKAQFDAKIHAFIGYNKNRTLPCNGYDQPGPVTHLQAGQVIHVRFWSPALPDENIDVLPPKPTKYNPQQVSQIRHGGGLCQMSLTYDGGKTFHKIAEYTRSCPDFHYEWPVKIPANVPSCDTLGQCLFIWSWTAFRVPQFYMNCADVVIQGRNKTGVLPKEGIQIANADGFEKGVTSIGDDTDMVGNGPNPDEVGLNLGRLSRILPSPPSLLSFLPSLPVIRLS